MEYKRSCLVLVVLTVVSVGLVRAVPVTVDLNPSDQLHIVPATYEVEDRPTPLRVVVAEPSVHPHQFQPFPAHEVQPQQVQQQFLNYPQQHQYVEQQQWLHRQQQQAQQSIGRPMVPLQHHQQLWDTRHQSNHVNKETHQHQAEEAPSASHFCIDGRCYALTPTQETAAEHQSHITTAGQEHHRALKRSVESNDVRQRFQHQPSPSPGHHQVLQQQQATHPSQLQRPTPPPPAAMGQQQQHSKQQQQNFRGQSVTGRPQQGDRSQNTSSSKDTASSAAFEKAVIDFEKISDMVSTFMIPIVRSSFDEGSSVFVIELDYSESSNTGEATVETEDESL